MSRKVNPIIFRLGILNQWSSKFAENKNQDLAFYLFNYLELKKFIQLFLKKYNIKLIDFKYYFNKNSLQLLINYENEFKNISEKKLKFHKLKNGVTKKKSSINTNKFKKLVKRQLILNSSLKYKIYIEKTVLKKKSNIFFNKKCDFRFPKFFKKRAFLIKYLNLLSNADINFSKFRCMNLFKKKIIKVFKYFFGPSCKKISIIFNQVKNNLLFNKLALKKFKFNFLVQISNFRQFEKKRFFKSGINLFLGLLNKVNKNNIAISISKYMSFELSNIINLSDFNLFLKFITNNVKQFLLKNINGIQIIIKGNLGKSARAFFKQFNIGSEFSKTQLNKTVGHKKITSFSKKGTLGISVIVF